MVPVFGICCTLSVEFYSQHVYISAVYEFYEALVIAAFFLLLCQYLHLDMASLRQVFTLVEPMKWIRPLRIWHKCFGRGKGGKTVDGLKWFNVSAILSIHTALYCTNSLDHLVWRLSIRLDQVLCGHCQMHHRGIRCVLLRLQQRQACQRLGKSGSACD